MRYLKTICFIFALLFTVLPLSVYAVPSPLEKTVSSIENGDYLLNIYQINTEDGVYEYLGKYLRGAAENNVEVIGITIVNFTSAENGTRDGSFSFFAELEYANTRKTTKTVVGSIYRAPVIISAVSSQSSIFAGGELTLSADVSDYDGGKIYWYESSSPNKNGHLISETKTTHIAVTPEVGTKYYRCVYKGSVSNTVTVNVTEAFVPVSDVVLPSLTLVCNKSTHLSAEIYPENATKTDITWKVTDGDASIISDRITVHTPGIITVRATITDGGANGANYEKYFEFYAEESEIEYKEVKWSILPPVDGILQMNFTASEKKDVQITAVSSLTADKLIAGAGTHSDMKMVAGAYIVCDDVNTLDEISIQLDSDYANKEVHVISSNADGSVSHESLTVSDTGEIVLPKHKNTYIITAEKSNKADLSFLLLLLPLIPLMLIPIFLRAAKDKETVQNKK